jgi:hypothetical protein
VCVCVCEHTVLSTVLFCSKHTYIVNILTFENLIQAVQNQDFARASVLKAKLNHYTKLN